MSFSNVIKSIEDVFLPSTKISRDESDVLDEWVAKIWAFDNFDEGMRQKKEMKILYRTLNHNAFENDIYLVRSIIENDNWILVIDIGRGKSSESEVTFGIEALKAFSKKSPFSQWISSAKPLFYSKEQFKELYGDIEM